jgi:hypothetical protein
MGSSTKINQCAAAIHSALLSRDQVVNIVELVFAVGKHLLEVLLCDFQSIEALSFLENLSGLLVQDCPIAFLDNTTIKRIVLVCNFKILGVTYPSGIAMS